MEIEIFADKANIKCGVGISLGKEFFPLECFFFETNPERYTLLLDAVDAKSGFVNEKSGIRFLADLDWEDEDNGIILDENHLYVFTHDFGDKVVEIPLFLKVLEHFLMKFMEVNSNGKYLAKEKSVEISKKLSKVNGGN